MLQEAFSHPSGFTVFMAPMAFTAFHGFTVFTPKHTSTGEGKFSRAQTVFSRPNHHSTSGSVFRAQRARQVQTSYYILGLVCKA